MDIELIRRILVEAKTTGVEQTTAQLKGLSVGYEGVAVASEKTEAATESVTRKFQRLEGYLDPAARAARQLAKDITLLDQAMAQGDASAERHAQLLSIATTNAINMSQGVTKATGAQKLWAETTAAANAQAQMFASSAGPIGFALSSIGKSGLVAAAGIGAIVLGYRALDAASTRVSNYARDIKHLADETGLTTSQLQALNKEASTKGIGSEDLEGSLRRLTTQFAELRDGGGTMLDVIRQINSGLADQLQVAQDDATRLTLLGQALAKADELQRAQILGRRNLAQSAFFVGLDVNAVAAKFPGKGLSEAYINELDKMRTATDEKGGDLQKKIEALFAVPFYKAKNAVLDYVFEIGQLRGRYDLSSGAADAAANANRQAFLLDQQKQIGDELERQRAVMADPAMAAFYDIASQRAAMYEASLAKVNAELDKTLEKGRTLSEKRIESGALPMPGAPPPLLPPEYQPKTLTAKIADYQKLKDAIGSLVPVEQQVTDEANRLALALAKAPAESKPLIEAATAALLAHARVQAELAQVAPGTYDRQLKELEKLKAAYPGLTAAQAGAARNLDQQLALANAVTAAEKMQVQEAINFTNAKGPGVTAEQAHATAAKQTAIAQAQITAAAKDQLFALQNAAAGAAAVTGQQKIEAQYEATINQLKRQNVDATMAASIAEQERANAIKQANAAVEQTIHGIENEIELINTRSESEKNSVLIRQAYNDAIRSGADAQAASALASAVAQKQQAELAAQSNQRAKEIQTIEANRATEISRANRAIQDQNDGLAESVRLAIEYNKWVERIYAGETLLSQMDFNVPKPGSGGSTTSRTDTGIPWGPGKVSYGGPTYPAIVTEGLFTQEQLDKEKREKEDRTQKAKDDADKARQDKINQFEMRRVEAQIGGDKPGEVSAVQGELAFYKSQPRTLENLTQIKSLTDTLKQLTDATKDNTQSQNALSGLYSRQFGQGFYDGGAAVGELIYGLDNNTSGAIDDMQKAANDNTRNQNDLLKDLSQKAITTSAQIGTATVAATTSVQNELRTGFSYLVETLNRNAAAAKTTQGPTIPAPTNPNRLPGFAAGGSFTTQGSGADDSNVVAFRVSPQRERVTIAPATGAAQGAGGTITHYYNNDITITIPQNTDEFRASAMQVADEIFNQVAIAGRRK